MRKNIFLGIMLCLLFPLYGQEKVTLDLDTPEFEALKEEKRNELLQEFFTANMPNITILERATYVLYNIKSEIVRNAYVLPVLKDEVERCGYTDEVRGLVEDIVICSKTAETIRIAKELEKKYYPLRNGAVAPDFDLQDEFGMRVKLSEFKGKLVFIDVWSLENEKSSVGLSDFVKLKERYKNRDDVVFLTISIDAEKSEDWKKNLKSNGYSGEMPHLIADGEGTFKNLYCVTEGPRYMMIDQNGKIVNAWHVEVNHTYFPFFFSMELEQLTKK